jgi:hypothetical protein
VLIAAGVNAKAITTCMGHASLQTTCDLYRKLMPGSESEAAALLDAYLNRTDTVGDWLSLSFDPRSWLSCLNGSPALAVIS